MGESVRKESILLVDDNATNLQVLYQTLEGLGCKLLVAKDGEAALAIVQKAHPDLILLDIMMPGIDGFEVCRRLKADRATRDIPIIFLSALDQTEDKVKGLQLGAVDYVSKPFQPDEIKARVNTHLTIHRLRREVEDQKNQLEHELEVVSDVQRKLLPKQLPQIENLRLAAYYQTSRYAGGDYYDILALDDQRWGILVADAEGHSAPAAVLMAMTCILFRSYPDAAHLPDKVIGFLNEHLCKVADPSFMTALYGVFDSRQRRLTFSRAGHPLPMIYHAAEGRAEEYDAEGVAPLGIFPYESVPRSEVALEPGDRFLFYTDGVSERFNPTGQLYGEARLLDQLARAAATSPREGLEMIMADVDQFAADRPADDDQALVLGFVD